MTAVPRPRRAAALLLSVSHLVLVARREHRLFAVRENSRALGAGHEIGRAHV